MSEFWVPWAEFAMGPGLKAQCVWHIRHRITKTTIGVIETPEWSESAVDHEKYPFIAP